MSTAPTPAADETPEPRKYVLHFEDGGVFLRTAEQLASDFWHAAHGDAEPFTLWTFVTDRPVRVVPRATQSEFDDTDFADVRVELLDFVMGTVLDVTGYRLDGRS
jgi:hypothetical protein